MVPFIYTASSAILETSVLTGRVVISRQLTARHPRIRRSSGRGAADGYSQSGLSSPRESFLPRVLVSLENVLIP